jgi:hypothetical protein
MPTREILIRTSILLALLLTPVQMLTAAGGAPQDEEQSRDIKSTEVTRSRRGGQDQRPGQTFRYEVRQTGKRAAPKRPRGKSLARGATTASAPQGFPVGHPPKDRTYVTVGVTLWRVRAATEAESRDPKVPKELMTWDQQEREVVVSRISDDTPVSDKDLIQMSVEYLPERAGAGATPSNLAGYLYVINREQLPDGSMRNPRLIFPTRATYGGDNRLLPGKTVTLPAPGRPFRIRRDGRGPAQAYEAYTIILSPVRLDADLPQELGKSAMGLPPELLAEWERRWGTGEFRADLVGGMGQLRTQRELGANGDVDGTRSTEDSAEDLTQGDPPPQTVFRKVVRPSAAVAVTVRLPFKETSAAPITKQ